MTGFLSAALYRRQHLGLNNILLVLGPRGIGKSYCCLKIAESRDPTFNVDRVVFDLETFLSTLKQLGGGYKWVVFDELGLEISARQWLSSANKIMSYVTQSFRFTKVNLAISTPSPDYVDIHTRQLADFWLIGQTRGRMRVYSVKQNPFGVKGIQTPFLGELEFGLPSESLIAAYEEKRKEVMDSKYAKYLQRARSDRLKRDKSSRDLLQEALILYNQGKLVETKGRRKGELSAYKISNELSISLSYAYRLKSELLEKIG